MEIAIIGGGAAGFFAAISAKQHHPAAGVTIYEKTSKLLAKVKVSGGGRCNVTNACYNVSQLVKFYPRGSKQLKKAFGSFSTGDTVNWFETRGVKLKTEPDNRMFPITDSSQTIIDCLTREAGKLGVKIIQDFPIHSIQPDNSGYKLTGKENQTLYVEKVIITTGGSPKLEGFKWLEQLGHVIESPVPSLFTFNMPEEPVRKLMGVSVSHVSVRVQGTKLKGEGPLLITHWGMSGPAILKLSAYGARVLYQQNYNFKIQVNWLGDHTETDIREVLSGQAANYTRKKMLNANPFNIPSRLWDFLLNKIELREDITWGELGKKGHNRLINILINDIYEVRGKTTFKEEFVTCGGVSLQDVDFNTMQSRKMPGVYFAGEVLDIDGVTGGFNFQVAWTTGYLAGQLK
ncbi:NAD(P)/FAD-dependent oxidoreductase [Fulvivirga sp. 29W222]|uniref:NAD(P)/FAD-dependent oxidoreductase n=1 Tax=Fulvivirga marina TaxID=2494733 RepID=A0A937FWI1_9BACT|nr:NAD(P)/FAD-dependent oxidoreductase [Fulvivirga marina]MBL6445626.1 NAD(P)/FAD-dependent oxidoreductase [Fulvivirga marina]